MGARWDAERKIVIGTLAVGCILGLVLWVMGSGAEPAPMGTGSTGRLRSGNR